MTVPEKAITDEQFYYETKKNECKRPPDIKFIQQRLPTGHPVLNTAYVIPTLTILSLIFIPLGIGIWIVAQNIPEITITYNDCASDKNSSLSCEDVVLPVLKRQKREDSLKDCNCRVNFTLDKDMNGTVYMYYALTNFYQNHLKYYQSRDANQLKGKIGKYGDLEEVSSFCKPYDYDNLNRTIIPCGLQANTMFNDVIQLVHVDPKRYHLHENGESKVNLLRTGIAWESDRTDKFKNPEHFKNYKHPIWRFFGKPMAWKTNMWGLDIQNRSNNGLQNEDFIVWMKTAAFPNFRKLYRIVDNTSSPFQYGLPAGNYSLLIEYNYEVSSFSGTKSIILTTTRTTAGRNHFLGSAYMATGSILLVLDIIFLIIHLCTRNRDYSLKDD